MSLTHSLTALISGGLIGIAALIFSGGLGRVMGVSGIIKGLLPRAEPGSAWRYYFFVGLLFSSLLYRVEHPGYDITLTSDDPIIAVIAGLLVGIGTSLANGCTSGHAVCGIGRLSTRSILSTITFVSMAFLTVALLHFFS